MTAAAHALFAVFLVCVFVVVSACSLPANQRQAQYVTNTVNGKDYYHIMYVLRAESVESMDELNRREFYDRGGQFELRILKAFFPVSAPNCQSSVILRMPWVNSEAALASKYELYKQLLSLYKYKNTSPLPIAIELNPYVNFDEQGIFLTHCNVFFRHSGGEYIPHTH